MARLSEAEIGQVLSQVSYSRAGGYTSFELEQLGVDHQGEPVLALQLGFDDIDAYTGNWSWQRSRKWILDRVDEHELLRTCLAAVLMAEEHEARERFLYAGKRIFHPHQRHAGLAPPGGAKAGA